MLPARMIRSAELIWLPYFYLTGLSRRRAVLDGSEAGSLARSRSDDLLRATRGIGGAARLCKFDPEPGKITSPDWGAAVSPAGVYATETAVSLGNALVSKMMLASSDPQMRANAVTPDGAQWPCHFVAGDNQRGDTTIGHARLRSCGCANGRWSPERSSA